MQLSTLYQTNRKRFIKNLKDKVLDLGNSIALFKGSHYFFAYDAPVYYPPKYDQNFVYLFGLEDMNFDGFIELDGGKTYLVQQHKCSEPLINYPVEEWKDSFGVEAVLTHNQFVEYLTQKTLKKVFVNHGVDRYTGVKSNSYDNSEVLDKLKDIIDNDTTYPILNNTRTIKSPEEIEFMREIGMISSRGHIEVMKACKEGVYEYQIGAVFNVF
jgi:Xaa-Pro aminopeptidase